MRKIAIGTLAAMVLVLFVAGLPAMRDRSFRGEIIDNECAQMGSHGVVEDGVILNGLTNAKECTRDCVKLGDKYVLYDAATRTIFGLDNQQLPWQFAGENVNVIGSLDKPNNTIHVMEIRPVSMTHRE